MPGLELWQNYPYAGSVQIFLLFCLPALGILFKDVMKVPDPQ